MTLPAGCFRLAVQGPEGGHNVRRQLLRVPAFDHVAMNEVDDFTILEEGDRRARGLVVREVAPGPGGCIEVLAGEDSVHLVRPGLRGCEGHRKRGSGTARSATADRIDEHELRAAGIGEHGVDVRNGPELLHAKSRELFPHGTNLNLMVRHYFSFSSLRALCRACQARV